MSEFRAKAGGEWGLNGVWYNGGEFLPAREDSTPTGIKKEKKKLRKVEIAPYKYEVERENERSIWATIDQVCLLHQTGYTKETGTQGIATFNEKFNAYACWRGNIEKALNKRKELIKMWNEGTRWIAKSWCDNYRDITAINSLLNKCTKETTFQIKNNDGTLILSYYNDGFEDGKIGLDDLLSLTEKEKENLNKDSRQNIKKLLNRNIEPIKECGLI